MNPKLALELYQHYRFNSQSHLVRDELELSFSGPFPREDFRAFGYCMTDYFTRLFGSGGDGGLVAQLKGLCSQGSSDLMMMCQAKYISN